MIITCKKEIPARWIAFTILPWASFGYTWGVVGVAFLFSLKKFVENPAGLTFILSLPTFLSIIFGPCVSFISDRIWTRFGRRKPFIVTSWAGIATCLILMPLMPTFLGLVTVYMAYYFFSDLNTPLEPLNQEIIPPHERGRSTGAMQWCTNLAGVVFYFIALGRFDDVTFMAGVPFVGEDIIYWSAGLLLTVMLLLIMLGIKEMDQKSKLVGQKLTLKNFFGGLLDPELWPVYMLVFGSATLGAGLGPLGNLLYTDQWNYTKQDMGINIAVGGVLNMFIIGLLTVFADKLNRMKAYRTLICISVALNFSYFCYVTFVLPDQRPSLVEIIAFGETGSIIGLLTGMVYVPLVYDYIRRNKMGTYFAGASLVTRVSGLITLNGVGLFIWAYALVFQPPAGEMTRVVLRGDQNQKTEVRVELRANPIWTYPQDGTKAPAANIEANAWQANGTVSDTGRAWEVRLRNKESEKLAKQKDDLVKDRSILISEEKLLRDTILNQTRKGQAAVAAETTKKANAKSARIEELSKQIDGIDVTLAERAKKFQTQVTTAFASRLITEGDQVLGANAKQAIVVELATNKRPDVHELEQTLNELRHEFPSLIDLRPLKRDTGYGIAVSAVLPSGTNELALAKELQTAVERVAGPRQKGLLTTGTAPLSVSQLPALALDLMVVENPIDSYVSPITRVVNVVLRLFDAVPRPDRRISATARNLRSPTDINHVRVEAGTTPKTITVTAVIPANAPMATVVNDPISLRMQSYFGAQNNMLPQARAFYDRVEKSAALQRITVARPLLTAEYAPMKYNYMSGYIWMLLMGLIGITITMVFARFEAKGLIHKRGVEEALAS
jgi:Na+/melibiose symporter-like transporter